jgi:hypothetical protein
MSRFPTSRRVTLWPNSGAAVEAADIAAQRGPIEETRFKIAEVGLAAVAARTG